MIKSFVIAGDVAVDWIEWESKPADKTDDHNPVPNWMLYSGLQMIA